MQNTENRKVISPERPRTPKIASANVANRVFVPAPFFASTGHPARRGGERCVAPDVFNVLAARSAGVSPATPGLDAHLSPSDDYFLRKSKKKVSAEGNFQGYGAVSG